MRSRAALLVTTSLLALAGCGQTYLDTSATTLAPDAPAVTYAPVDPATPLAELFDELQALMIGLDERIVDGRDPNGTLARIDELWAVAEPQIRQADLDSIYNFQTAIDLARSGVAGRRPADASKGYKVLVQMVDSLGTTPAG